MAEEEKNKQQPYTPFEKADNLSAAKQQARNEKKETANHEASDESANQSDDSFVQQRIAARRANKRQQQAEQQKKEGKNINEGLYIILLILCMVKDLLDIFSLQLLVLIDWPLDLAIGFTMFLTFGSGAKQRAQSLGRSLLTTIGEATFLGFFPLWTISVIATKWYLEITQ